MAEFQAVFDRLKPILQGIPGAIVVADEPGNGYLCYRNGGML